MIINETSSYYASIICSNVAGETICVTKGIVTGVKTGNYLQSSTKLLTIQIDATTNDGNSGGPVITGNKVVGVVFQDLGDEKSTG